MTNYTKGKAVKLTRNFKSTEFDCKGKGCCSKTPLDIELLGYVQVIRNRFKKPVKINSGYRCQKHNKKAGGAKNSRHTQGMAADIAIKGVKPIEIAKFSETIGIQGIGLYDTFVHIDTRTTKFYWKGNTQKSVKTFK